MSHPSRPARLVSNRSRTVLLAATAVVAFLAWAGVAGAADRVFWANRFSTTISYANLDNSGGGAELPTTGATPSGPFGVAIDIAHNRVYWPNYTANTISFANLDGTGGGGELNTSGTTVSGPTQVSLDLIAGRIYWSNHDNSTISFAKLDGSGGGTVPTTSATVSAPFGVAVDHAAGRIYWANAGNDTISFANLDGSGGGNVTLGGAVVSHPIGVAVDTVSKRIYWANFGNSTIEYSNLNGSGGGNLLTTGATVSGPEGVALDIVAGKIYWSNPNAGKISFANLNNTGGGGDLNLTGATPNFPTFPVLLKKPVGTGAPAITGTPAFGGSLGCTTGSWAADETVASLFQSPGSFSYQWTLNGAPIAGGNAPTQGTALAGTYQCTVTATNAAGSTAQTSGPVTIVAPPPDTDHDGIVDPNDKCPTVPAGKFDVNHDGCPGPYAVLHISTLGGWSVSDKGVEIASMKVQGLRAGVKVKFVCKSCHVKQTFTAKGSSLTLKKLKHKTLKRGKGFTLTVTGTGLIGDVLTLTVKHYGHKRADFVRASRAPFKSKHACIPIGATKSAKTCSTTPPTGP